MAGNNTFNSDPAIRAQVYSEMLMESLHDGFLPASLSRDVSDFGDGSLLLIPTIGEMPIVDITEEEDTPVAPLSTGQIQFRIKEHKGIAGYVTDELKEDGLALAA